MKRAPRPPIDPNRTHKPCSRCRIVKPVADFAAHRGKSDGLSTYCKPCLAARRREWKRAHPDLVRADKNRRKLAGLTRLALYQREGGRCHICKRPVPPDDFHVEHLYPLAAGGETHPSNLAIAHPTCNKRKKNRITPVQLRLA